MTYSIVARDRTTGELGVAVQSQSFNTGAAVPWAWAGVGAVATQSFTDRRYGWRGLERLRAGEAPGDALGALLAEDAQAAFRQVGMIDVEGRIAQATGTRRTRATPATTAGRRRETCWPPSTPGTRWALRSSRLRARWRDD